MARQLPLFGLSSVKRELSSALTAEKKERAKAKNALALHGRALKQLERAKVRASRGKKIPAPVMLSKGIEPASARGFAVLVRSLVNEADRDLFTVADKSLASGRPSHVVVTLINLPKSLKPYDRAEAENNRFAFIVNDFAPLLEEAAPGKVRVEQRIGVPGPARLRAKSGTPAQVAKHLADYINKIVATVLPQFTHSKPPAGY